jgi:thymidylate synthase
MDVNSIYKDFIGRIVVNGETATARKFATVETIGNCAVVPMTRPLVTLAERKMGYKFAFAEASWILSGKNDTSMIGAYSKTINNFSDDGEFFAGAYGPRIIDQLPYIIDCFKRDIGTRQAVINIWRDRPYASKDIPCTLSIQFLARGGLLHVIDCMRSSDAWLGVPYDWFNFSMLGAYVSLLLRRVIGRDLGLGNLYFHAASSHLYINDFGYTIDDAYRLLESSAVNAEIGELTIEEFYDDEPEGFIKHLDDIRLEKYTGKESLRLRRL